MEFEVARCRPMLGDDFFAYLDRRIGALCGLLSCWLGACYRRWWSASERAVQGAQPLGALRHQSPAAPSLCAAAALVCLFRPGALCKRAG